MSISLDFIAYYGVSSFLFDTVGGLYTFLQRMTCRRRNQVKYIFGFIYFTCHNESKSLR